MADQGDRDTYERGRLANAVLRPYEQPQPIPVSPGTYSAMAHEMGADECGVPGCFTCARLLHSPRDGRLESDLAAP